MMRVRKRFAEEGKAVPQMARPYVPGKPRACPRCGGKAWIVGRSSAECGNPRCGHLLPLAEPEQDESNDD